MIAIKNFAPVSYFKSYFNGYSKSHSKGALLVCTLLLSGCFTHTIDQDPQLEIPVPLSFSVDSGYAALPALWWQSFNRPVLTGFIEQSLANNYRLAQAQAVLQQARALALQTDSERWPQLSIDSDISQEWEDGHRQGVARESGLSLAWEWDIWNRMGYGAKADRLEAQVRRFTMAALKLSLSGEVAKAYFGAVAARRQMALLQQQAALDKNLEQLLSLRWKNGVGTQVEVLQQQAQIADSEALLPLAEAALAVFENRLDVLLGQAPDGHSRVPVNETLDFVAELPAIGVPAALLLHRPDLLAARTSLVMADAEIGVAIAQRLPSVTLDGSYAFSDDSTFTGPVAMIMGTFIQPLLDWGQRKAEVERNQALYRERLAAYTQLYLEALEQVENALIQEAKQRQFLSRVEAQRKLLQQAVQAAEERYKQGVDDYQPVINALQELRALERNLIDQQRILLGYRIDLFQAIGGPASPPGEENEAGNTDELP